MRSSKIVQNLWTVWKSQAARLLNLWITSPRPLRRLRTSVRICPLGNTVFLVLNTLKTAANGHSVSSLGLSVHSCFDLFHNLDEGEPTQASHFHRLS